MFNPQAAALAIRAIEVYPHGDEFGKRSVIDQLRKFQTEQWIAVSSDCSLIKTEEARHCIGMIYLLLTRNDPTYAEYRGAVLQSIKYIEANCPWLKEYV